MGDQPDPQQCRLLAGPAAIGAQLLLGALALGSLLYKRHVERPQRPLKIWGLDVSKQVVSMLAAHICGMLIALIAHHAVTSDTSECSWYFVAFSFDTTIGLLLTILLHKAALRFACWYGERYGRQPLDAAPLEDGDAEGAQDLAPADKGRWFDVLQQCGNYGDPPSYRRWAIQLAEWVSAVVLARALCGTLVVLLGPLLAHIAQGLDHLFSGHPTLQLYFVMICCPLLMNICQMLIQDLVLKWRSSRGAGAAAPDSSGTSLGKVEIGTVAEREASLLGPAEERSAVV